MEQRRIGDVQVSALGIGGAQWSLRDERDDEASAALLERALDLGVSYIDTAAAYTIAGVDGHNESLIAKVLCGRTDPVIVGTKGGHYRSGNTWPVDGRPETIRANCESSLRALDVSELDLYYLHKPDPSVPFEDSVGTLEELRREGKVARTGISNVTESQVRDALAISPLSAVQNQLSPTNITDLGTLRLCESLEIAYVIYSPLGGVEGRRALAAGLPNTRKLAAERDFSLESVVLSWELSLSNFVIPVVGASRLETLVDALSASSSLLDDELAKTLESEIARLQPA